MKKYILLSTLLGTSSTLFSSTLAHETPLFSAIVGNNSKQQEASSSNSNNLREDPQVFIDIWMKDSGAIAKCQSADDINLVLSTLKNYPTDRLATVTTWMKDSGAIAKCRDGSIINLVLSTLKNYPADRLATVTTWMKDSGAIAKLGNGFGIYNILFFLKDYPADRLATVTTWMKDSGAWDKCKSADDIDDILSCLKNYPTDRLATVTTWMKDSGAWDKCQSADDINKILSNLKNYPADRLETVTAWMKDSGAIAKCQNGSWIAYLLSQLREFDLSLLRQTTVKLPLDQKFIGVYAINLAVNPTDIRYKETLEQLVTDNKIHLYILNTIISFCGEDSAIAQHFIQLAIGYNNMNNPNSFLAVHQEMLTKRADDIVGHNQVTLDQDLALNIDLVKEPVSIKAIHMPINVWNRLFDKLKALPANDQQQLAEFLQETSLDALFNLQTVPVITELLDPLDSLKVVGDRVTTYSLKLREILHNCIKNDDMGQFIQLLVNIQTCTTGKINGIVHSYNLMNNGRELDESIIGEQAFKKEITNFFKEELRRLREVTLIDILRQGLKLGFSDPHDLYYLRGVIGGEIGLNQMDEIHKIDIHGHVVNKTLRSKTKQQLLDLFYQYYKVEDVVSRIHILLNNGSVQISGSKNLTVAIINEYLQDTAYDSTNDKYEAGYVMLDEKGIPFGLTPAAAKKLLVLMGFLVEVGAQQATSSGAQ